MYEIPEIHEIQGIPEQENKTSMINIMKFMKR